MPRPTTRRIQATLLALLVVLCGCALNQARPPNSSAALDAQLAQLPPRGGPDNAVRRSVVLRALGRHADALAELTEAEDEARAALDWHALFKVWRETGELHLDQGRPQQALEAYAKRIKPAIDLGEQPEQARALVDAGYALSLLGMMSKADHHIAAAQLLAGDELAADALTVEHMALARERLNDSERAAELFAAARDRYRQLGDAAGAARCQVYRARLETQRTGDARALEEAELLVTQSADPEPRARLLRFQAEASYDDGQPGRCQKQAEDSARIADRRSLVQVGKLARVLVARCAAENNQLETAIRSAEEAGMIAEEQRNNLTGDQARQEAGFEAYQIYRLLLSLQTRLPEGRRAAAAFVTAERARARAHVDAVTRSRALQGAPLGDPLLLRSKEEAEERVRRLTQELTSRRADASLAERQRNALWALEDLKEAITQQNPLLSRIDVPQPATPRAVRETMLDGDALLVSYFVAQEQVVVITVDAKSEQLKVLKSSPELLGKAVRAFRRNLLLRPSRSLAEVKEAAARLYAELLGPIDDQVRAHKSLLIIPHGELASLPFEALVAPDGRFLVESHDVSYSLSATLGVELARGGRPTAGRRAFVALGDPVYDWASFKANRAEGAAAEGSRGLSLWIDAAATANSGEAKPEAPTGLTRLPGTGTEVRAIAKLFGPEARIYLREQASEENIKAGALADSRIVHIASHGLLEPHYNALALTLNPASKEDGFLLHSEIVDLRLNADLVVLSACQTGATHLRGAVEPVAGLALALRSAGARRVVVSLWSVDDDATARLMTEFYKPLVKEDASYSASLSQAKRSMLAKGPSHPFFWAPFILLGN